MLDKTQRNNILICNDDGIKSNGLITLAERLAKKNNVLVVAPDDNRSACSHSLTIGKPIRLTEVDFIKGCKSYSISGTPVDCVKFAKLHFNDFHTQIVVSGINKAHNLGDDILYSGTVAIAYEAAYYNYIAFAFSNFSYDDCDFTKKAEYCEKIIDFLLPYSTPKTIWNVNFPQTDDIKGVKITKLGYQIYTDRYEKVEENSYLLVGELVSHGDNDENTDVKCVENGYISITPLSYNKTDYKTLQVLQEKCIEL